MQRFKIVLDPESMTSPRPAQTRRVRWADRFPAPDDDQGPNGQADPRSDSHSGSYETLQHAGNDQMARDGPNSRSLFKLSISVVDTVSWMMAVGVTRGRDGPPDCS